MKELLALPPPLDLVDVPESFGPTSVVKATECPLSAVLSAASPRPLPLPPEPRALFGSLLHSLVKWAAEATLETERPREAIETRFEQLLAEWNASAASDPVLCRYVPLEGTMAFLEFRRRRSVGVNCAEKQWKTAKRSTRNERAFNVSGTDTAVSMGVASRAERLLHAKRLRLRGWVDSWETSDGQVTIRDYKTGRVREPDGSIRPHIAFQLRLYALMAKEVFPAARIRLFVEQEDAAELPFDDAIAEQTERDLGRVLAVLPANAALPARALAVVGPHCRYCDFRPVCGAYRSDAPAHWRESKEKEPLPWDIWGRVENAPSRDKAGRYEVSLRDTAGRHVRVTALSPEHGNLGCIAGKEIWFFNLEAHGTNRGASGAYVHPVNFRELGGRASERRAWRVAVFLGLPPAM